MRPTGPTNPILKDVLETLRQISAKGESPIWKRVAKDLKKPRRIRRVVNLSTIDRECKKGDKIVVPGKVLSYGNLSKPVEISAWEFSQTAADKIEKAGGKTLPLEETAKKNPKGKGLRIIG